jgi:hypothetical protein
MSNPLDRLITAAAKEILGPLGFRRKGRSRLWLSDEGWWSIVVEFQPSGWTKGSYLNVGTHWLWVEQDHLSFDHGDRVEPFRGYLSEAQFQQGAMDMAHAAAEEAQRLRKIFPSVEEAATILATKEKSLPDRAKGSWPAYHAGVAAGLSGKTEEASGLFRSVIDDRVRPAAGRMKRVLPDPVVFRQEVDRVICEHRQALGLPVNT